MKEQILNTSDESAKFVKNISGWVDRHGRFWGKDEDMARWSGCTHIVCKCGDIMPKGYTICSKCREIKSIKRYEALEGMEWDDKTPLYSELADEYFFDSDELEEYVEEHGDTIQSLRLIICEPINLREVSDEYFCEELSEDGELPKDVISALNELNEIIRVQEPVGWYPGKYAAII